MVLMLPIMLVAAACGSGSDGAAPTTAPPTTEQATTTTTIPFGDEVAIGKGAEALTWAEVKPTTTPVETSYGTVYVFNWPGPQTDRIGQAGSAWMEDCTKDTAREAQREILYGMSVSTGYMMCLPEWYG